jgi:hypothetical protein
VVSDEKIVANSTNTCKLIREIFGENEKFLRILRLIRSEIKSERFAAAKVELKSCLCKAQNESFFFSSRNENARIQRKKDFNVG